MYIVKCFMYKLYTHPNTNIRVKIQGHFAVLLICTIAEAVLLQNKLVSNRTIITLLHYYVFAIQVKHVIFMVKCRVKAFYFKSNLLLFVP